MIKPASTHPDSPSVYLFKLQFANQQIWIEKGSIDMHRAILSACLLMPQSANQLQIFHRERSSRHAPCYPLCVPLYAAVCELDVDMVRERF